MPAVYAPQDDMLAMAITDKAISHRGMMLMGYQRTKQISRKSRLSWEAGDPAPLDAEITARRAEVFQGTLSEIYTEYLPLRDALRAAGRTPGHVVDIGCGAALNDVFLVKDFGCEVTLIDIEETPSQYHQWSDLGSGYAALADAKGFLESNGAAADRVHVINPRKNPDAIGRIKGDLVTSLFSCGFHYPITDYVDLMLGTVASGGAVVLDLRKRYLQGDDPALSRLRAMCIQTDLLTMEKSKRVMFTQR